MVLVLSIILLMVISRETKAKVQHYKLKLFSRKRKLTSLQLPYTHVRDHGLMIQNDTHVREQRLCTVVSISWMDLQSKYAPHVGTQRQANSMSTSLPINTKHTTRQKAPNFWESSKHANIKCFKSTLFLFLI